MLESWKSLTVQHADQLHQRRLKRQELQDLVLIHRHLRLDEDARKTFDVPAWNALQNQFLVLKSELAVDKTLNYFPFAQQVKFHSHARMTKYDIMVAGNRAGKTKPLSVDLIWLAQGNHPWIWVPPDPQLIWYVSVDYPTAHDVGRPNLMMYVPQNKKLARVFEAQGQFRVRFMATGSDIVIKSQETGPTKFQGAKLLAFGWDEEGNREDESEKIFNECLLRVADSEGMALMSFTPLKGFPWIRKLVGRGLEDDPDVTVHRWATTDNPYFPHAEYERLKQDLEDDELRVRIFAEMIPLGVNSVFTNRQRINEWRDRAMNMPFRHADFQGKETVPGIYDGKIVFADEPTSLRIYREPENDSEYEIGCDPSGGGGEKGNPAAIVVMRKRNREVVATFRSRYHDTTQLAHLAYCLGYYYRTMRWNHPARVTIEVPNHGWAVIQELERLGYPNLYRATTAGGELRQGFGFVSNASTKAQLEGEIKRALREDSVVINDPRICDEMLGYIRFPNGSAGAAPGSCEDFVIAFGICLVADSGDPILDRSPSPPTIYDLPRPQRIWHEAINGTSANHPWKQKRISV